MASALKNKNGNAAIFAIAIVLSLVLLFTVVSEYLRLQIIASGVRDAVQSSVIAVATQNYDDVYNGLREGYSGAYALDNDEHWEESLDTGAVMMNLSDTLGLIGGSKYSGDHLEYTLSNLDIQIRNSPIAPSGNHKKFEADVRITLEVPLSFGWEHLPAMQIRLKVSAGYTPKF